MTTSLGISTGLATARDEMARVSLEAIQSTQSRLIVGSPGLGKTHTTRSEAVERTDLSFVSAFPTRDRAREGVEEWVRLGAKREEITFLVGRDPEPTSPAYCANYTAVDRFRRGGGQALAFCTRICPQRRDCRYLEHATQPPRRLLVTTTSNLQARFRQFSTWEERPRKLLLDENLQSAVWTGYDSIPRRDLESYASMLTSRRQGSADWVVSLRTAIQSVASMEPQSDVPEVLRELYCEVLARALLAGSERFMESRRAWLTGRRRQRPRANIPDPFWIALDVRTYYARDVADLERKDRLIGLGAVLRTLLENDQLYGAAYEGGFLRVEWERKAQGDESLAFSPWLVTLGKEVLSAQDGERVLLRIAKDPQGRACFEYGQVHRDIVEAIRAGHVVNTCTTPLPASVISALHADQTVVPFFPENVRIEHVVGIKPTARNPFQLVTLARFLACRAAQVRDGRKLAAIVKKKDYDLIRRVLKLHRIPVGSKGWIQLGCYGKDHSSTNRYTGVEELHVGWFMIRPDAAYWQARIWEVALGLPIESVSREERRRLQALAGQALPEEEETRAESLRLPFSGTAYTRRWASLDPPLVRECMFHSYAEFVWNATGRGRGIQDPDHEYRVFVWCDIPFPEEWMRTHTLTDYRDLLLRFRIRLNVNDIREACVAESNAGRKRRVEHEAWMGQLIQLGFPIADVATLAGASTRWVEKVKVRNERNRTAQERDSDANPRMKSGLPGGSVALGEPIPPYIYSTGAIGSAGATLVPLPGGIGRVLSQALTRTFSDLDLDFSSRPLALRVAFASLVAGVVSRDATEEISHACREDLGWTDLSHAVLEEQLHHRWYTAFARELSIALRGPASLEAALALAEGVAKVSVPVRSDSRERFYDVVATLVRLGACPDEPRVSRRVLDVLRSRGNTWASDQHALRTVQRWMTHDATREWWRRWRETLLPGEGPTEPLTKEDSQCA